MATESFFEELLFRFKQRRYWKKLNSANNTKETWDSGVSVHTTQQYTDKLIYNAIVKNIAILVGSVV